ncbi:DUF899 domain-containing protein [Amycolatopsis magusensis]|uniref:DUF899 domain-containing protein n=1 Tax=Amycolatopsis magusensis TaxID=882444 RepID=UPI003C2E8BDD
MRNLPEVVSREQWLTARKELLTKEKALTRAQDQLNADRRRLPMVRVDQPYTFTGPDGETGLAELFEGRSQLIVHHLMWLDDAGTPCPSCSSIADGITKLSQLHARDTTLVAISRGTYPRIAAFLERMGWTFPWYSAEGSTFNHDFHATVDERVAPVLLNYRTEAELAEAGTPWTAGSRGDWPGISTFLRVGDEVFHTYSTYARGLDQFVGGNHYLDLTALGRQEDWEEPKGRALPLGLEANGPAVRFPDEYATTAS